MKYDHPFTRNVRFWIFVNDGLVKITLKPEQELRWYRGETTDEGWSSEELTFQYDSNLGKIFRINSLCGMDCDGRLDYYNQVSCGIDDLNTSNENYYEMEDDNGNVLCFPDWREVSSSKYDQYAEMAGY